MQTKSWMAITAASAAVVITAGTVLAQQNDVLAQWTESSATQVQPTTDSAAAPSAAPSASTPQSQQPSASSAPAAAPGSSQTEIPEGTPQIHLTFDDGPDPTFTPQILDILAAHGATATFFVQGSRVQAYPAIAQRIVAEGHSLQNHSWSHPRLTDLSYSQLLNDQLLPTNAAIVGATGIPARCLRPTYGLSNETTQAAAAAAGLTMVGWTINPADYTTTTPGAISQSVLANAFPGGVVLLHDAGGSSEQRQHTVAALQTLLPALIDSGYAPTALCM